MGEKGGTAPNPQLPRSPPPKITPQRGRKGRGKSALLAPASEGSRSGGWGTRSLSKLPKGGRGTPSLTRAGLLQAGFLVLGSAGRRSGAIGCGKDHSFEGLH